MHYSLSQVAGRTVRTFNVLTFNTPAQVARFERSTF